MLSSWCRRACFSWEMCDLNLGGKGRALPASSVSQISSAQSNQYSKAVYLGVACSEPLQNQILGRTKVPRAWGSHATPCHPLPIRSRGLSPRPPDFSLMPHPALPVLEIKSFPVVRNGSAKGFHFHLGHFLPQGNIAFSSLAPVCKIPDAGPDWSSQPVACGLDTQWLVRVSPPSGKSLPHQRPSSVAGNGKNVRVSGRDSQMGLGPERPQFRAAD